jgi:peptidyl-prolyl cis-trans isomerase C
VLRLIVPLVLIALLVGCSSDDTASAPGSVVPDSPNPTEAPEDVAPVPSVLPDVVARVNDDNIAGSELQLAVTRLESQMGAPLSDEERSHVIREVLGQLIAYRLLTQEATTQGLDASEGEIDAELALAQARFPSAEVFEQALAEQETTLDSFRTETRRQIAVGRLIEAEVTSKVVVTPEDVTAFYEENPEEFEEGAQVQASHILIAVATGAEDAVRAAARERAEQLLVDINAGSDFAALAREVSDDPGSGAMGGDLGFFGEGAMVPEFEQAAFTLQPGETSGLVETQFGYHIIRVVERLAPQAIPLNDVRVQLEQFLQGRNQQDATQAYINALRERGTVDILI